jgi:hypothetical protein
MVQEIEKYRSTADLYIREAPTTASKILGGLKVDGVIEKVGESEDGKWARFLFNNREGWSSRRYLAKVPYIPSPGEDFPWRALAEGEKGVSEEYYPRSELLEYRIPK